MKRSSHFLNLPRLEAFVAICEEGSLSRASERLCIAQPALSSMMHKMESDLNVKILDRHSKGSSPTPEGEILLKNAYDILGMAEFTLEEIGAISQEPSGEVSIGLPAATSMVLAVPLIKHLSQTLPKVQLKVVEAFSGYLWDWLGNGDLDIAICFDRLTCTEIICQPLCFEELFLVGRTDLMPENQPVMTQGEIKNYPLILPSRRHGIRHKAENYAAMNGGLKVILEIDASVHLVQLVSSGEGFGLLAKCAVTEELRENKVKAIPLQPRISREISIGVHRVKANSPVVKRVISEINDVAQQLFANGEWPILCNSIK